MKQFSRSYLLLFLPILVISAYQGKFFHLNLNESVSNGTQLKYIGCYQAEILNIDFNTQTTWLCENSNCIISNNEPPNKLQILFQTKTIQTYLLTNIYLSKFQFVANSTVSIIIEFTGGNGLPNEYIYMIVPINTNMNSSGLATININHIPSYVGSPTSFTQKRYFNQLQDILTDNVFKTKIPQSFAQTFQFLNSRDYGKFYAMKDNSTPTISYIVSWYMYQVDNGAAFASLASLTGTAQSIYYGDGAVICYGSSQVIVSSISKNYQLWINFFAILLFGCFFIAPRSTTLNISQEKFVNNRFTCWIVYSIYFLQHAEYYTKNARAMPYFLNFTFQSLVLSLLYSKLGVTYQASMIGWAGVVAWVSSIWIPIFFGCIFIRKIQNLGIIKLQMQIDQRQIFRKNAKQIHETNLIELDEQISAYYYWYYSLAFLFFVPVATLSVYFTQDIPKGYEYINLYWIASIGVSSVLDLLFQLIMACIFGGTFCYQSKGLFYQSKIGQLQQKLKQNPT